ncbi:MAG: type IX secretion system membrane protein PorP/SprF [Bacteroidota bacterium]|nr:MAG: type IX secretion system membrane protein PorP/SprF [Bacteroidota bacterium]
MKRITLPTMILLTVLQFAGAQQYPYFTQYTLNKFVSNPAAAGIDGYTTLNFIAREQWVGHGGTPKTHALIMDSRILGDSYILRKIPIRKNEKPKTRSGNTAWGAFLINDINGPISKTYINGTYAYHLDLGEKQLSFGLSMLLFQNRLKAEQFVLSDNASANDPLLVAQSYWIVDANFGAYLTGRDYYAGYSTVQLFNSSVRFGIDGAGEYRLNRQHNLIGGYRFFLNNRMDVEPSMLVKLQENMTAQMDLSAKFIFDKTYWGGINLRTGKAFALFGGMNYLNYYFGYAFEYNFNAFAKLTFATHELTVIARFGDAARRYKWLNSY